MKFELPVRLDDEECGNSWSILDANGEEVCQMVVDTALTKEDRAVGRRIVELLNAHGLEDA